MKGKFIMVKSIKPGSTTGSTGGIYQEIGPKGGKHPNFTTIPEYRKAPPTSTPGSEWRLVKPTPKGHK